MSKKSKVAAAVASAGILAAGWAAGTAHGSTVTVTSPSTSSSAATSASSSTSANRVPATASGTATTSGTAAKSGSYRDGTYTGSNVTHRYGSVMVTVTVKGGAITDVSANVADDGDRKSKSINSTAVPTIKSRVLAAGSAAVSTVSGATYTTQAYLTSLQAALGKAA